MATAEILARIDRTLDRIDARLEASERRWAESERRWEERDKSWREDQDERDREWRRFAAENRRFNDALLERHAGITNDLIAAIHRMSVQQSTSLGALQTEIADQRAQIQAQTEAIWRMIDRLPPQRPQG